VTMKVKLLHICVQVTVRLSS